MISAVVEPRQHSFRSVVGHDLIKKYLSSAWQNNVLPHALLMMGPKGVGKLSLAYSLAKYANCASPDKQDCLCDVCRKIGAGIFADVLLVEPRGAAGQITLNGWREGDDPDGLQYYRFVNSRPLEGEKKVLIIRQADRMNVPLANYLLKLIEEPPSYLLIVLVTHRPADLLVTIRSRCAPLRFSPLTLDEMNRFAAGAANDLKADERAALLRLSDGRPGLFLKLLDESGPQHAVLAALMLQFQQQGFVSLFGAASDLCKLGKGEGSSSEQFEQVLTRMEAWFRDVLISQFVDEKQAGAMLIHSTAEKEVRQFAAQAPVEGLTRAADEIRKMYSYGPRQGERNYVLELLLMQIGRAIRKTG